MPLVGLEDEAVFAADDHRRTGNVYPGRRRRVYVVGRLQLEPRSRGGPADGNFADRQAADDERRRLHMAHAHLEAALTPVAAIVRRGAGDGRDTDREEGP